jgi:hypothetical protein
VWSGQRYGELCGVDRGTVSCVLWTEGRCVVLFGQRAMSCVVWTKGL